jgi:hypothetical protein
MYLEVNTLEIRTDFFLPALWSLVGANPAQEARCLSDSNIDISAPMSKANVYNWIRDKAKKNGTDCGKQ